MEGGEVVRSEWPYHLICVFFVKKQDTFFPASFYSLLTTTYSLQPTPYFPSALFLSSSRFFITSSGFVVMIWCSPGLATT